MKRSLGDLHPWRWDAPLLLTAAGVLLAIGLSTPVLTVKKLWKANTFSILGGIGALRDDGHVYLASLVFFFSVVFPIVKLVALAFVWGMPMAPGKRKAVLAVLSGLGKWSMLDVFIVAILIVAVKLGALAKAEPLPGIYYFGTSVLLAMTAAALIEHLAKKAPKES